MESLIRFITGALGGLIASASKVMALDIDVLARAIDHGLSEDISSLKVTIFVFTPILMMLGGLIAWATVESNRMKLLAIGCAAPALIAPWTSSNFDNTKLLQTAAFIPSFIVPAYASPVDAVKSDSGSRFKQGLKVLFGWESTADRRYWVIVGSNKNYKGACKQVLLINSEKKEAKAFVGARKPGNLYYPVIVGGPNAFYEIAKARRLKENVSNLGYVGTDLFLSSYDGRRKAPVAVAPAGQSLCNNK